MAPSATFSIRRRWPTCLAAFLAIGAVALLPIGASAASASPTSSTALLGPQGAQKTTFYVAPGGTASSCAKNSASNPFASIEAALACTANGDVVKLAPTAGKAPYPGVGTVDDNVALEASGGNARTVSIDVSTPPGPLVVAPGSSVTLQGVTLECVATTNCDGDAPDVTNNGNLVLSADAITGSISNGVLNESTAAGAANLTVLSSTIADNHGIVGGSHGGAGINSLVATGTSTPASVAPSLTVDNSTIADNGVDGDNYSGGGIDVHAGSATLVNDTIVGNTAIQAGGGIYATSGTHVALANTLVAGNHGGADPDCDAHVFAMVVSNGPGGHNLIGNGAGCSDLVNATDGDVVGVAQPGVATLGDFGGPTNTVALQASSPAIGAGNPATCEASSVANLDQRGKSRHATARGCDIGAYDTGGDGGVVVATFYVAPGGTASSCTTNSASDPFGTIEAALACTANGDVVKLAPTGKTPYAGIGTVDDNVVIEASGGKANARTVSIDVSTTPGPLVVSAGSSVTLQGVTLECVPHTGSSCPSSSDVTNHGILVLSGDSVTGSISHGILNESTGAGPANLAVRSSAIYDNTFFTGTTDRGGGIDSLVATGASTPKSVEPSLTIDNSTIAENEVSGSIYSGGGIDVRSGAATLVNDTIVGNAADVSGGGIHATLGAHVLLSNTLIAGNDAHPGTGADCYSATSRSVTKKTTTTTTTSSVTNGSGGHNLIGNGTGCGELVNGTDGDIVGVANAGVGPLFDNGGPTNTLALEASSPAIGAANPATCEASPIADVDQRGVSRHATTQGCDIGAYDNGGAPIVGAVSPASGTTKGGQTVTVRGTDLTGATKVTFGGISGTNVSVISSTEVMAATPPHSKGTVFVQVTNADGTSALFPTGDTYTYEPGGPPFKPAAPTAVAGDHSATITWTAPTTDGSPVTKYTVTSSPGKKACTTTGPTTCMVEDLTNGKPYTFTIVAQNKFGKSPASIPSNAVTPSA